MRRFLSLTWALCGLSVLSAQTPYTLKSCLETGLERNYSIRIARNDERISSSNATRAAAGALPTLDFSAGYDGALSDSRTRPRAGETSSENGAYDQTVSAGLDLEWTIFEGFRIRTDYRRLQELKAQGELETRIAIEDFVASLAAEYYNFVQQKIRLKNFRYAVSHSSLFHTVFARGRSHSKCAAAQRMTMTTTTLVKIAPAPCQTCCSSR